MRLVTVFYLGGNWREGFDAINSADHQICCSQRGGASLLINAPLWIDNATYPLIDCLISDGFRAASEGPLFSETPSCEAAKIFPSQQKIFNVCNKHAAQQLFLLHMQIIQLGTIWNEDYRETKKLHLEKTCKLMTGI
ncbi:hypothetical protein BDL97_18G036500 [Sphagnum fallax]|nr:hypothetical protein BDL97_18G036500 [Sphagnum fallax]